MNGKYLGPHQQKQCVAQILAAMSTALCEIELRTCMIVGIAVGPDQTVLFFFEEILPGVSSVHMLLIAYYFSQRTL